MGLFGGETIVVASTVYNMAGDVTERPDYLKTLTASNVISNSKFSMSESINSGYINGPGIKIRQFHRWALNNYTDIGVPTAGFDDNPDLNLDLIEAEIPHDPAMTVFIQNAQFGAADPTFWAEQWLLTADAPGYFTGTDAWSSEYNQLTGVLTLYEADGTTVITTLVPTIDLESTYWYVYYGLRSSTEYLGARLWIYKIGSGNTVMDGMLRTRTHIGNYLPFIPIRLDGEFLSSTHKPDMYALAKRAYKKATSGQKLDKLIEKISDNPDLDDIDHAYIVHGVALNCFDNPSRKYLFKFFDELRTHQGYTTGIYTDFISSLGTYDFQREEYDLDRGFYLAMPTEGDDPTLSSVPPRWPGKKAFTGIKFKTHGDLDVKLDMEMSWVIIKKTTGTGLKKPGALNGEVWWGTTVPYTGPLTGTLHLAAAMAEYNGDNLDSMFLHHQVTQDSWETLEIVGLVHKNRIYKGKAVVIQGPDALAEVDESGFIIPIHYETMKSMSLIESTQMMTASTYLVFNSYEVVKQRWYQTIAFKIVIFVVVIAITVATAGAGAVGILGTAGSVGASLGFTGLAATIVGAVANALAAMILMQLISIGATKLFGAKLGMLIATVATALAMSFGSSLMSGQTMASAWGNMMSAQNLLGLTSSVGNGIAGYMQASVMELQAKTAELMETYKDESGAITQKYLQEFGLGTFAFDPNQLTNNNPGGLTESPQMFLDRTLLTGSDIADMSLDMLSNFANYTLDLNTSRS